MAERDSRERDAADGQEPPGEISRLRDRTDEIELIISGLTTVALFTLPGWLFERLAEVWTHMSLPFAVGGGAALLILTGLCYGLGACFLLHLMARAYWVGLIGLRTVFPQGINWQRTPGIGPLTREYYRARLPDLAAAIQRSDRLASLLFAVISVVALGILWIGALALLAATAAGLIGARFGAPNTAINYAVFGLTGLALGVPGLLWLLDAKLVARWPKLMESALLRSVVRSLARVSGWLFPQRLVLPVQLTLQSNTRPALFIVGLVLSTVAIVVVGQYSLDRAMNFTVSGEFRYLDGDHFVGPVFRNTFYEDMRSGKDRLRGWPMIPAFEQRGSHVRLFLPYHPLRDNPLLERLCPGEDAALGAACVARLWAVALNDDAVALETFLPGERMDLGMRGLLGIVPLEGLRPGLQELTVTWNPRAEPEQAPIDDRYSQARVDYHIPFLFAPDFERELDPPEGETAPIPEE